MTTNEEYVAFAFILIAVGLMALWIGAYLAMKNHNKYVISLRKTDDALKKILESGKK